MRFPTLTTFTLTDARRCHAPAPVEHNLLVACERHLFDEIARAGRCYVVRFSGTNVAGGFYFYRLQGGEKVDLKKLLRLK